MNKLIPLLVVAVAFLVITPAAKAVVTIAHVQNAGAGFFNSTTGSPSLTGGMSVGFFATNPLDSDFGPAGTLNATSGDSIFGWSDLLAAGYTDVRSVPGATMAAGFDWDYPIPVGGSEINIPIASLPAGTQLYLIAFNLGTYNTVTPGASFVGATEWAVVKDTTYLSPADNGVKVLTLSVADGAEILQGADVAASPDVQMTALIPEPSRAVLALLGFAICGLRRRR